MAREIKEANLQIDVLPDKDHRWKQDKCPWNNIKDPKDKGKHKCAVKGVSICKYFKGVKDLDTVICAFPEEENPHYK